MRFLSGNETATITARSAAITPSPVQSGLYGAVKGITRSPKVIWTVASATSVSPWTPIAASASVVMKRCTSSAIGALSFAPNGRDLRTSPAIIEAVISK